MKKKYLTIGEVSNITEIPPHTLRYWESEFNLLRPLRRESGQRRYTHNDIHTIEKIKTLLYEKKFTISGAKKRLLKEKKQSGNQTDKQVQVSSSVSEELEKIKQDLINIKNILNS